MPSGQLSTHFPCESTKPGKHPVHCNWFTVEATLKFGIAQVVHLVGQLSHSCLLLSAIRLEPWHTPLPSALTQLPFSVNWPAPQMMQSPDVAPLQVLQSGEHGSQAVPLLKLPSGQRVPEEVEDWTARHCVPSLAFRVKSCLQETQSPVPSEHCVQPSWHTVSKEGRI